MEKEKADLGERTCCYCGRKFRPVAERFPWENEEFYREIVKAMKSMLDDGLPLECGKCRKE